MKNSWTAVMRMRTIVSSFVVATALIAGCSGGGSSGGGTTTVAAPTGTVTGQVASAASNVPVAGATVSTTAGTTTSAADGSFTVPALAGDRSVVHVEASGFAEAFPVGRVTAGQTTSLGVRLLPTGYSTSVIVANGAIVTDPNSTAQVIIPANALVPKAGGIAVGTVTVAITPINPAVDVNLMPGDFMGVSAGGGSPAPMESFGAMLIDIRDNNGTRYTLAAGKTSTIRIPVGTRSTVPPATSPLFYFDESTGLWMQEGTATLLGTAPSQYYEGPVTHFSIWNADYLYPSVYVSGCVRDSNNQPVANLLVVTNGFDYSGTAAAFTAADGTFKVALRPGSVATLSAAEVNLQTFTFTTLSNVGPSTVDFTLPTCLVKAPGPLTITTSALPGGNVGVAYNQTLAATGGIPGYVWSLDPTSNPLPAGLSLNPSGVISGTPTTAGTTTITVKVTDSAAGTATKQLSVTISPPGVVPVAITSLSPLPSGTVGTVYTIPLTSSGGTPALSWSVVSGALPVGLALNPSTGQISGTPTTAGTSTFTIRVQDSGTPQQFDQKPFSLTINAVSSGGGGTLTVTNAPAIVGGTFVADPQATLANAQGRIGVVVWGESDSSSPFYFENVALGFDNTTGQVLSVSFQFGDVSGGGIWACDASLPPGCPGASVDMTTGTFTVVNMVLTDPSLSNPLPQITLNGTLTWRITITSFSPLAAGRVGTAYSTTLAASGGTLPLSWSVISGALPAGLMLTQSTGQISGTPTTPGTSTFTIQVQDRRTPPESSQREFSLTINAGPSGGAGGTLTVVNAPASIGNTFVADPQGTTRSVQGTGATVTWSEVTFPIGPGFLHVETVALGFDTVTGQAILLQFFLTDFLSATWGCLGAFPPGCLGVSVNKTTGTLTLLNTVLTDTTSSNPLPPITLNGTLSFTP